MPGLFATREDRVLKAEGGTERGVRRSLNRKVIRPVLRARRECRAHTRRGRESRSGRRGGGRGGDERGIGIRGELLEVKFKEGSAGLMVSPRHQALLSLVRGTQRHPERERVASRGRREAIYQANAEMTAATREREVGGRRDT